ADKMNDYHATHEFRFACIWTTKRRPNGPDESSMQHSIYGSIRSSKNCTRHACYKKQQDLPSDQRTNKTKHNCSHDPTQEAADKQSEHGFQHPVLGRGRGWGRCCPVIFWCRLG